jgi:hypothetical protein
LTLGGGTTLSVGGDFIVTEASTVFTQSRNTADQGGQSAWAAVTINARNVRIDAGSKISADAQGYPGGTGPGAGGSDGLHGGGGGGYGGVGGTSGDGTNRGGPTYGEPSAPLSLGSGGGLARSVAGVGGGAIKLRATGTLLLDGAITAKGGDAGGVGCSLSGSGGGSGGSILVVATTLTGGGSLHADGGAGGAGGCTGNGDDGGGGGGGRVAVHFRTIDAFAGVTASSANGGFSGIGQPGNAGTILFIGCGGDCNGDGRVVIDELIRMINVALGTDGVTACLAGDTDFDETITVSDIVSAVEAALRGCRAD